MIAASSTLALAGWALVGAGLAAIAPTVLGAAPSATRAPPGVAIAAVTSIGYLGSFTGPPLIGVLAEISSLSLALSLLVIVALLTALIARRSAFDRLRRVGATAAPDREPAAGLDLAGSSMPAGARSSPGGTRRSAVPPAPSRTTRTVPFTPDDITREPDHTLTPRPQLLVHWWRIGSGAGRPAGWVSVPADIAPPSREWIAAELNRLELELGDELAAGLRASPAGLQLELPRGSRPTVEDAAALVTNRVYRSLLQPATADPAEMNATAITNALQARGAGLAEARRLVAEAAERFGGRAWLGQLPTGRQSDSARPLWRLQMPAGALRDAD